MKPVQAILPVILAVCILGSAPLVNPAQAQSLVTSELTGTFTSGDYGGTQTTDRFKTTLFLGYRPDRLIDFGVEVSHLIVSNSSSVSSGRGVFSRGGTGIIPPGGGSASTASVSGLGDVEISTNLNLVEENALWPAMRILARVKLPTADDDKGLGTGETDYTTGIGLLKWFADWQTKAEATYVFQGDNDQLLLENYATLEAAIGYRFNLDLLGELIYWGATAPVTGIGPLGELQLKLTRLFGDRSGITLFAVTGLTRESLDYGLGGSLFVNF